MPVTNFNWDKGYVNKNIYIYILKGLVNGALGFVENRNAPRNDRRS